MELKDFIKTALSDIVNGVKEAEEGLKEEVSIRCHTDKAFNGYPSVSYTSSMHERQAPVTIVDFKVKLQVTEGKATDGKIKAGILNVIGGGISGEISHTNETTQELSFSIPIVWKQKKQ